MSSQWTVRPGYGAPTPLQEKASGLLCALEVSSKTHYCGGTALGKVTERSGREGTASWDRGRSGDGKKESPAWAGSKGVCCTSGAVLGLNVCYLFPSFFYNLLHFVTLRSPVCSFLENSEPLALSMFPSSSIFCLEFLLGLPIQCLYHSCVFSFSFSLLCAEFPQIVWIYLILTTTLWLR